MIRLSIRDINKFSYQGDLVSPNQLGDNREAVISNRPYVSENSLIAAKNEGAETIGNSIVLYHGTRSHDKIDSSKKLNLGSFLSSDTEIAKRYALAAQQSGKPTVIRVVVPAAAVFPQGNKYWSLNEPINLN